MPACDRDWGPERGGVSAAGCWCAAGAPWRPPGKPLWATLAGVHLAGRFQAEGITHIHAPWANGPATAAWVASGLSGIPFSFCGHAHDIYPPDGALQEKLRAAQFRAHHLPCQSPLPNGPGPGGRRQNRAYHLRRASGGFAPVAPGNYSAVSAPGPGTPGGEKRAFRCSWRPAVTCKNGGWIFISPWRGMARSAAVWWAWCRNMLSGTGCPSSGMCPTIRSPSCLRQADLFVMPCLVARRG